MLLTRVLTAVVLLAVLLAVLYSQSFILFVATTAAFLAAATWESARLFQMTRPALMAVPWVLVFLVFALQSVTFSASMLFALCVVIWLVRFIPALAIGLPQTAGLGNRLVHALYGLSIVGCFAAIFFLYQHSGLYLLSVLAIVWVADIGAYFSGKAFGRRKLAPSISPGKSWEGAIGGWVLVLLLSGSSVYFPALRDTFAPVVQTALGWVGLVVLMTLLVAASVLGDLFESMLKRRAGVKDSSHLLPGHGGVLDRIDALIPVLPLAALVSTWV